jgi:hypothetical protein
MTTLAWITLVFVVVAFVVMILARTQRTSRKDLGSVSLQWIVEHRKSRDDTHDR